MRSNCCGAGSAAKGKVLCVVRLVFNDAGNKLFWRCPWCPFSRDAPSSMHTHFERRHPGLLGGISKVAYLRPALTATAKCVPSCQAPRSAPSPTPGPWVSPPGSLSSWSDCSKQLADRSQSQISQAAT